MTIEEELRMLAEESPNDGRINDPKWREMMTKLIRLRDKSKPEPKKIQGNLNYGCEYIKKIRRFKHLKMAGGINTLA